MGVVDHDGDELRLLQLPPEIFSRILDHLSGKSISTMWISCPETKREAIETIAQHHLLDLTETIARTGNYESTVRWIRSIVNDLDTTATAGTRTGTVTTRHSTTRVQRLSRTTALIDYLRLCQKVSSTCGNTGVLECPIWVGQLQFRSAIISFTTSIPIFVTTPLQLPPCWIPGASRVVHHRIPTTRFRSEPMRLTPIPRLGRIRGLLPGDTVVLPIAPNQVGVPVAVYEHHQDDPLDIRILSAAAARRRMSLRLRERYGSLVTGTDDEWVCCWSDDNHHQTGDEDDAMSYIVALLRAYERTMQAATG